MVKNTIKNVNKFMKFKEWLLLNEFGDDPGDDSIILKGRPAYAKDAGPSLSSAREFQIFRKRLQVAEKLGNPLININLKSIEKIPIISPEGKSLPDNGWWKHVTDK
jgi:hypothetical protein